MKLSIEKFDDVMAEAKNHLNSSIDVEYYGSELELFEGLVKKIRDKLYVAEIQRAEELAKLYELMDKYKSEVDAHLAK